MAEVNTDFDVMAYINKLPSIRIAIMNIKVRQGNALNQVIITTKVHRFRMFIIHILVLFGISIEMK